MFSYDDVVDVVVYSSSVDLLLAHLDVEVHHDQLVDDELLVFIRDVNLFDVCTLLYPFDIVVGVLGVFSMLSSMLFPLL